MALTKKQQDAIAGKSSGARGGNRYALVRDDKGTIFVYTILPTSPHEEQLRGKGTILGIYYTKPEAVAAYNERFNYTPATFHTTKSGMAVRSPSTGRMMGSLKHSRVIPEVDMGARKIRMNIEEAIKFLSRDMMRGGQEQRQLYFLLGNLLDATYEVAKGLEQGGWSDIYLDEKMGKADSDYQQLKKIKGR